MRPFKIDIAESDLDDLRGRIAATRWPASGLEFGAATGWGRGIPQDHLRSLAAYWLDEYDWRAAEATLNSHPQYLTEIDGATVHFLHVRSPEPDAVPLLVTHGWPGSVAEFLDVIGPLTDPRAHGRDPSDAFHLVIPSIPGYGFSGPITETGWGIPRIAAAWAELMSRLGYSRYAVQGGDWGSLVSLEMARTAPQHVTAAHVTLLIALPSGDEAEMASLTDEDRRRLEGLGRFDAENSGYMKLLRTRPSTPAYGMNDSPVGLLAWIAEKYQEWTTSPIDRDRLLTTVMIYWLTGTAASSVQLYYEVAEWEKAAAGQAPPPIEVPVGVAAYADDLVLPIRTLAERDVPTIVHWSEFDRGGHFPAIEVPDTYVNDLRTFARTAALRTPA